MGIVVLEERLVNNKIFKSELINMSITVKLKMKKFIKFSKFKIKDPIMEVLIEDIRVAVVVQTALVELKPNKVQQLRFNHSLDLILQEGKLNYSDCLKVRVKKSLT